MYHIIIIEVIRILTIKSDVNVWLKGLTLFWMGRADSAPHEFFDCSGLKDCAKGGSWGM